MKQRSTRRRARKSRKTRRQRGGGPLITFKVVLFSLTEPSDSLKQQIKQLLDELYGGDTTFESSDLMKYQFASNTGLPEEFQAEGVKETVFSIENPPAFLGKQKIRPDTRLTALEGQIAQKLLKKGINVSLIPAQHGLYDQAGFQYIVGLMHPASVKMTNGMYQNAINKVMQ